MVTETALATVLPNLGPSGAKRLSLRSDTEIYEYSSLFHYVASKYHECRNPENCEACRNFHPMASAIPEPMHQESPHVLKQDPEFVNMSWTPFHDNMPTPPYQYMGMYQTQGGLSQGVLPYSPPTSPPNQPSANLRTHIQLNATH
ncbi:hypothetical protein JTE90_006877 [Oedothorax gibbosus]|uniref:Uncharacterized protein n=1 Tax=Oedothorax gibbosus TaxID=931172 RepID=A0AAV6THA1_9ARAC|nr:hypothetical protein JTE90_006877 [Oedothorax gibbosus]